MTEPLEARARSVFDQAIDSRGPERAARLDQVCAGAPELRRRVEALRRAAGNAWRKEVAQNPAQQPAETGRNGSQRKKALRGKRNKSAGLRHNAENCGDLQNEELGVTGLELPASFPKKTANSQTGGAKSGAVAGDGQLPVELVAGWALLPSAIRQAVTLLVQAATRP